MTNVPAPLVFDSPDEQAPATPAFTGRTDEERARDAARDAAYQQSLLRRPCGFFLGTGTQCLRPTCGASWRAHYGDPPAHVPRTAHRRRSY